MPTINDQDLCANHPLLLDEINDGFRAPDLGWVGSTVDDDLDLDPEFFEAGSLVFSNWWAGSAGQARELAVAMVLDFRTILASMEPGGLYDEGDPTASVCYWEDPATGLGLVCQQSLTSDLYFRGNFEQMKESGPIMEKMQMIGFDGNDNSPWELLGEISRVTSGPLGSDRLASLVISSSCSDKRAELREFFAGGCQ